jgi:uncharacterized BrkB/YihY/UPF0761 family membrane protein
VLATARPVVAVTREALSRHDALLAAAGLTCYVALGAVPLLALSGRIVSLLIGSHDVTQSGAAAARYLPRHLDLAPAARAVAAGATRLPWGGAVAALVIVSLLSEGVVRVLARFCPPVTRRRLALRGRICTVVLIALTVLAVLLIATVGRPLLQHDFGSGVGPRLFGIWLAFVIGWVAGAILLTAVYRTFPPQRLRWSSALIGGGVAASWLSGQSLGYVLVLRFVGGGIGRAYAGSSVAGTVAAILFLTYLQAVVFVLGFLLSEAVDTVRDRPCASSA